ncbi:MAG TPA: hypothetical protein VGO49_07655 [Bradyrhizobium sp.]|jgi:hypothetical protein|nr:hypothetical protein [Bradyrhizobium sp.]
MAGVVQRDWRFELRETLPDFFDPPPVAGGKPPRRPICLPECGPGWRGIIDRCCVRIGAALLDRERFRFERIRERQGALRIYWGGRLAAASEAVVREAVDLAEARSICVCELCGAEGRLYRADAVLMSRCVRHAQGGPAAPPGLQNLHLRQKTITGRLRVVVACRYDPETDAFLDIDACASAPEEE